MVRYLNPPDHHPAKIRKVDKDFARGIDFKDIKFPIKVRDIHKIEKESCISISVFGYEKRKMSNLCVKNTFKRYVDLLLIGEDDKRHYVLIKDFNTLLYDHTLHRERKQFCRNCLQALSIDC